MSTSTPPAALVTGAAKRIGRAIALSLGRQGWAVAVHHRRSPDEAAAVAAEIAAAGGRAVTLAADLSHEDETQGLMARAAERLGPIGCLVNNASLFEPDEALTVSRASWDAHMETNLRAPLVLTQAFARQLPKDAEGAVINMIDQRVVNLTSHFISYTTSRAALWTLTQTLALALAPRIRVNAIGPGPTLPSPRQSQADFARQCAAMPLGRGATPDEIAQAVLFILQARSMTGELIALDGGQHLVRVAADAAREE